jgi:hypothetical protein
MIWILNIVHVTLLGIHISDFGLAHYGLVYAVAQQNVCMGLETLYMMFTPLFHVHIAHAVCTMDEIF